jgi:hypothetical protein
MNVRTVSLTVAFALAAGGAFTAAKSPQLAAPGSTDLAPKTFPDGAPYQFGGIQIKQRPVGDAAVLRTLVDQMGFIRGVAAQETTDTINRLLWRGKGTMIEGGKILSVTQYTYNTSLLLHAMREDILYTGSDGKKKRIVQVVYGDHYAWDETEPGVGGKPANSEADSRMLRHLRTPFGFVRAALESDPSTVKVTDPGPGAIKLSGQGITVSLTVNGVKTTATLDRYYRPAKIVQTIDGKLYEADYAAYKDLSETGMMFPSSIIEKVGGLTRLRLVINQAWTGSYAVFPPPAGVTVPEVKPVASRLLPKPQTAPGGPGRGAS